MIKKKNIGLIILLILILVVGVVTITYRILMDENKLTVVERNYINGNKSNLIDVIVPNNANVFASAGKGVYYDFLNSFEKEYNLNFNKITLTSENENKGLTLTKGIQVPSGAKVFYIDHYVIIAGKYVNISTDKDIKGKIGVLKNDLNHVNKHLNSGLEFKTYDSREDIEKALQSEEVTYICVPMIEYLDYVLENLFSIVYHVSDAKDYYYMSASNNDNLTSILSKYYNVWSKDRQNTSFMKNEYSLFTTKLKLTEKELNVIDSKTYNYGFVGNNSYDAKVSGNYGGVMAEYLLSFSEFSGVAFNYKGFSNIDKLKKEISSGNIDLYVDYYGLNSLVTIESLYNASISVVLSNDDNRVFNDLSSLSGTAVYIKENSLYSSNLQKEGIIVKTYKNDKELKKLFENKNIVIMDDVNYRVYEKTNKNISERFKVKTNVLYNFKSNNDTMFNRLFTYYISTIDTESINYTGLSSYYKAVESGNLIKRIGEYAFLLSIIVAIVSTIIYRFGKKVRIKKKIKKSDKMKYIDVLTSLKNRNYLTESIPMWNQNTIYPQAVILINLNGIQELNDQYGYTEGDKQIQAFANILIKTQLDNSEIMRTDGNEFVIYMMGYNEKQVLSYIKKLNKEIKNLPYDKSATIGFSMIEDDVKLIDDAINEATEIMKKNKLLYLGEDNEENV